MARAGKAGSSYVGFLRANTSPASNCACAGDPFSPPVSACFLLVGCSSRQGDWAKVPPCQAAVGSRDRRPGPSFRFKSCVVARGALSPRHVGRFFPWRRCEPAPRLAIGRTSSEELIGSLYNNPRRSKLVRFFSTPSTSPAFRGIPRASGSGSVFQALRGELRDSPWAVTGCAAVGTSGRLGRVRLPQPTLPWFVSEKFGGLQSVGKDSKFPPGQGRWLQTGNYTSALLGLQLDDCRSWDFLASILISRANTDLDTSRGM
ncbi:uncharacterized protein LOC122479439 [Prionailurus bengalensis]|uniref:uncharacterized protein LOC122479439 n=1 Tax=Prionailurus bengalensis TaxID=37029 RepID=UPI001CA7F19A|nr:uncharacterized protein LOC122479439 [Prionailurus bengalensis]